MSKMASRSGAFAALLGLGWAAVGYALGEPAAVTVRDAEEFRQAVARAKPGARSLLAPGEYPGGFYFPRLQGRPDKPIVIAAADPKNPPVIKGRVEGMHLTDAAHVELRDLTLTGATGNGLNIDDGGSYDTPSHHVLLRGLKITDVGPRGNHDGVKLSGVDDFRIEGCTVERVGGQGIDMVGCHRGVIEGCTFRHSEGETGATGVQAKGGTRDITVRGCRFENAGARAVNIGGSTGLQFFRPPLQTPSGQAARYYEAKDIRVEGNTFIGGQAPVAFVGVDGAVVRFNTIYRPRRWALRILQETRAPGFVPCRDGTFTENLVVFRSGEWSEGGVNIGPGTAPETFTFARNFWYCADDPAKSRPTLPTKEAGGVYGKDPLFRDADKGDLRLQPNSPASKAGADALPK